MEILQLWAVFRRWWWLVLLPAVIALVLSLPALPGMLSPAVTYRVAIRFTASQPPPPGQTFEDQSYIPWLASEYAVNYLAGWARTDTFASETARLLEAEGKQIAADAIRNAINSDAVRSIMTLYIDWPDANDIQAIATAATHVLREKNGQYVPQFAAQPAQIIALDGIIVAPVAPPITSRIAPLLRVLLGLAVGIGLAFLAEYLDPTVRGRREVESLLGLPVIAEIPPHG